MAPVDPNAPVLHHLGRPPRPMPISGVAAVLGRKALGPKDHARATEHVVSLLRAAAACRRWTDAVITRLDNVRFRPCNPYLVRIGGDACGTGPGPRREFGLVDAAVGTINGDHADGVFICGQSWAKLDTSWSKPCRRRPVLNCTSPPTTGGFYVASGTPFQSASVQH